MKIYQKSISSETSISEINCDFVPDIFFLFFSPLYEDRGFPAMLKDRFPNSKIFGCSTAGEILGNTVFDYSIALTAVKFDKTTIRINEINLDDVNNDSFAAGVKMSKDLADPNLRHIFILSDGLKVNGAELVKGLHDRLSEHVSITGGLAGDGPDFKETFLINDGDIKSNCVLGLGLYGKDLQIGFGSQGGWDSFGMERLVTKSENNILYELDGEPALALYKTFLGEKAKDLPGSGLLFPLSMRDGEDTAPVVRTILAIDEQAQSLTFAGNIVQGSYVRLMKANVDRIIDGAEQSAIISKNIIDKNSQLSFLISCVGRRLVLKQLVEEEVEAVNEVLGVQNFTTGFYSYGEIAPFDKFTPCALHNQTMTITTFSE